MKRLMVHGMMLLAVGSMLAGSVQQAVATPFTTTSPTSGGALPSGTTAVGGIVLDMIGLNGARVVSQLSASSLYVGFAGSNPLTIGTQTGFDSSITGALGGGVAQAAVRITLFDGDTAAGNFDVNDNQLLINGLDFGNWSTVNAQETDSTGTTSTLGVSGGGFRDNTLDTGFFLSTNATLLGNLFTSLVSTGQASFQVLDSDPFDNFYDFTQGVNGGLINVGTGPTVQPGPGNPVPEPGTWMLMGTGLIGLLGYGWRRKQQVAVVAQ